MAGEVEHSSLLHLLNITGPIFTIIQFLSGLPVCYGFVMKGNTGDKSSLPFVIGALNCAIWCKYGFLIEQPAMQIVNCIGAVLLFLYSICFFLYSTRKLSVFRQNFFAIVFFVTLLIVLGQLTASGYQKQKELVGLLGAFLSVAFCASPLASVQHVIRKRTTESLPFYMILMNFIVASQWCLFGYVLNDSFVFIPNMLGCLLSFLQLTLFCMYPATSMKKLSSQEQQLL